MTIAETAVNAISNLRPDLEAIYKDAQSYTLGGWRRRQQALVTASGAAAAGIPVAHLVGVTADLIFLINRMSVCSYGIGAIQGRDTGLGNVLEEEDFQIVLNIWAGGNDMTTATAALSAKAAADIAVKVHSKAGLKLVAKTLLKTSGLFLGGAVAGPLGAKAGAKIGAKFAAKMSGKMLSGFVPFFGAAAGAGVNLWFITSIADAAEHFYRFKFSVADHL
jgi:hypothetical protein